MKLALPLLAVLAVVWCRAGLFWAVAALAWPFAAGVSGLLLSLPVVWCWVTKGG